MTPAKAQPADDGEARRREMPFRASRQARTIAERPERPLDVERRLLLRLGLALGVRTSALLKAPYHASSHRAHRQQLVDFRRQLRRYRERWRASQ